MKSPKKTAAQRGAGAVLKKIERDIDKLVKALIDARAGHAIDATTDLRAAVRQVGRSLALDVASAEEGGA